MQLQKMTELKYAVLLEELQNLIETTLQDLSFLPEREQFKRINIAANTSNVTTQPWTVLDRLLVLQLISLIKYFNNREAAFKKELENKKKLLQHLNEEALCSVEEFIKLEKDLKTLREKGKQLQILEDKLRAQYTLNKNIQEELDAARTSLDTVNSQREEISALPSIKSEPVEITEMQFTLHYRDTFRKDIKELWREYTRLNKKKRNARVVWNFTEKLENLSQEYNRQHADRDESLRSPSKLKVHKEITDLVKKINEKLENELAIYN